MIFFSFYGRIISENKKKEETKMDKTSKVLTVFAIIFLTLTIAAFTFSALLFGATVDVMTRGESGLGEAVGIALLIIFFIGAEIVFATCDVIGIVFGAIMIKRAAGKWRTFFIVDTAASGVMLALAAAMFILILS